MANSDFKDTYFRSMFIPIILIILILTFIFIILIVPVDMSVYATNASNSITSFLKG